MKRRAFMVRLFFAISDLIYALDINRKFMRRAKARKISHFLHFSTLFHQSCCVSRYSLSEGNVVAFFSERQASGPFHLPVRKLPGISKCAM
jgi:hypothetical protein